MKSIICLTFLFAVGYSSPRDSRCAEPKEIGPCRGAFPRFYFDQETSSCKPFFYGGCHGNGNNFRSVRSCLKTCDSREEASTPSAPGVEEVRVKDVDGSAANDVCFLRKDPGPCRGAHLRFYFNSQTSECEAFLFGGCDGNANNFRSLKQCNTACSSQASVRTLPVTPVPDVAVCAQEKKTGPCRGALPRFYFNPAAGKCESFVYGGCNGNQNNFRTEDECNAVCPATTGTTSTSSPAVALRVGEAVAISESTPILEVRAEDVCNLEAETGPCYGNFPRFAHNKLTGKCEEFTYGGCHGNGNNFLTAEECDSVCGNHVETEPKVEVPLAKDPFVVCALPADDGGCRAAFPMYYFNKESNSCEEFLYGGCQGNDNRFYTKESCDEFCKPVMQ